MADPSFHRSADGRHCEGCRSQSHTSDPVPPCGPVPQSNRRPHGQACGRRPAARRPSAAGSTTRFPHFREGESPAAQSECPASDDAAPHRQTDPRPERVPAVRDHDADPHHSGCLTETCPFDQIAGWHTTPACVHCTNCPARPVVEWPWAGDDGTIGDVAYAVRISGEVTIRA